MNPFLPEGAAARLAALLALPEVAQVMALLNGGGEEARLIGGAVRNALIGQPVTDADIATTALPQIVVARARKAGIKAVPTGIDHGTVTLVIAGQPVEVTTLREDVATDGRHAEVRFGRDWLKDAHRRDFTVNALSLAADGTLHDLTGGIADLSPLRIRFIGEAGKRIAEDYLRILRFFRFHAQYADGALDPEGLAACIAGRAGLDGLSRERIRAELTKLMAAPGALPAAEALSDCGIWQQVTGGVLWPGRLASALSVTPDASGRLAAAAVMTGEDADRLADRLRLSRAEAARLVAHAEAVTVLKGEGTSPRLRALVYLFGAEAARLALAVERPGANLALLEAVIADPPVNPFRAADLIAQGAEPGKALGERLKALEADWLAQDCPRS